MDVKIAEVALAAYVVPAFGLWHIARSWRTGVIIFRPRWSSGLNRRWRDSVGIFIERDVNPKGFRNMLLGELVIVACGAIFGTWCLINAITH